MGRISGYIQPVSIGSSCTLHSLIHEIGHVVGFWHEQNHPDRDKYVTIYQENVHSGYRTNFDTKTNVDSLGVSHDFNSIMHYSAVAFAKPGTVAISTKENDVSFANAPELSPLDIKQTNLLYKYQCG